MGAAGVSMYSKSSDVSDTACDIPIASEVERLVLPAQLTPEYLFEAHNFKYRSEFFSVQIMAWRAV